MTAITREKIKEKLSNLEQYFGYLRQLKQEAGDEQNFIGDFHFFGNAERYLQLSVQVVIDIMHLIIIELGLERPKDNYEAVTVLFRNKVLGGNLADKLPAMIGLRNILVHEYGDIDRKRVYKILKTELDDLKDFKQQVIDFLLK